MSDPSLTIVLSYAGDQVNDIRAGVDRLARGAADVSDEIQAAEKRVERLVTPVGLEQPLTVAAPLEADTNRSDVESPTWDELVDRASQNLIESGVDGAASSIDALLGPEQAAVIDELHGGTFDGAIKLDSYDIAAAVLAGVAGAFTDLMVVRIPTGGIWNGEWQSGSELTFGLRKGALDSDNFLSGMAKVPFDRVNETGISGMGPRSHRVQTFGHDPLLGWALGTMDIMRGTLTGIDVTSAVHVVEAGNPTPNLMVALGLQVGHLLSDVVTRMGLPLPGWTALLTVPFGAIGPDNLSVGEMARWMYLRGYGTWHLATMATSVVVTEAFVRSYYAIRQILDTDYEHRVSVEKIRAGADRVGDEPRYRSLSLLAHGIATAGNAGKLILHGGNPLALNVAQWAVFSRKIVQRIQTPAARDVLVGQHAANITTIQTGWAELGLDLSKPFEA